YIAREVFYAIRQRYRQIAQTQFTS
ncbi:hypothetical protein J2793_007275, partial [Paraburkholderia caledonica]|nr:hypothetical protein [Paraburkholderia caledonica]